MIVIARRYCGSSRANFAHSVRNAMAWYGLNNILQLHLLVYKRAYSKPYRAFASEKPRTGCTISSISISCGSLVLRSSLRLTVDWLGRLSRFVFPPSRNLSQSRESGFIHFPSRWKTSFSLAPATFFDVVGQVSRASHNREPVMSQQ